MAKNRTMAAKNAKAKQLSMKASKDTKYRGMQASYAMDDFANSALWHMNHMPIYGNFKIRRSHSGTTL